MFSIIKVLGKVGKGLATVVGIGTAGAAGGALVAVDLNESLRLVLEIITALGLLLASFGIGRKGGYAAADV